MEESGAGSYIFGTAKRVGMLRACSWKRNQSTEARPGLESEQHETSIVQSNMGREKM